MAGLAIGAIGLLQPHSQVLQVSRQSYGATDTEGWIAAGSPFLQVIDISFLPETGPKVHQSPTLEFPPQENGSCRLYIVHQEALTGALLSHIAALVSENSGTFYDGSKPFVRPELSRRLESGQMPWWQTGVVAFGGLEATENLFEGLVRCNMRVRCCWLEEDRMIAFIFCVTTSPKYAVKQDGSHDESSQSRRVVRELDQLATRIIAIDKSYGKREVLIGHIEFLHSISDLHNRFLPHLSDPGRTTITSEHLGVISQDSYFWEQIMHIITVFIVSIQSLLDSSYLFDEGSLPDHRRFKELLLEIRALCMETEKTSDSISSRLEGRLKFIEMGRIFHESNSLRILSLLAAIFLPLSLASSLLSMQTRFRNLGNLLYDFVGVAVLLGSVTMVIVLLLKYLARIYQTFQAESPIVRSILSIGPIPILLFFFEYHAGLLLSWYVSGCLFRDNGPWRRVRWDVWMSTAIPYSRLAMSDFRLGFAEIGKIKTGNTQYKSS